MSTPTPSNLPPTSDSAAQPGPPDAAPKPIPAKPLDILFLQDATGSQGPYIKSARTAINDLCTKISSSAALSKGALRFGLIAFRDHPPQDRTFVTKNFGFTDDTETMKKNLAGLAATGGGDGPEASTAALAEALNMEWEEEAVKIVVLITDAPPHGIGEGGDGFPNGSPDQNDPLEIARQMAERGITLYVIACEPTLSNSYRNAVDFYRALCLITTGKMVPLLNAAQLGDYIVGSAVETMETEALIDEYQKTILEDVYGQGKPLNEVMESVQAKMESNRKEIKTFIVEDVYLPSEAAERNTKMWQQATSVQKRGKIETPSGPRLKPEFAAAIPSATAPRIPSWGLPTADLGDVSLGGAPRKRAGRGRGRGGPPPPSAAPSHPGVIPGAPAGGAGFSSLLWSNTGMPPPAPGSAPLAPAPTGGFFTGDNGSFGGSAPQPQQQQQAGPQVQLMSQQVDHSQTKRVVMQSLMRNAKVGPGNVLIPQGAWAGSAAVSTEAAVQCACCTGE